MGERLVPNGIGVETEKRQSDGVTVVIVGIDPSKNGENFIDPKLWTIIERKSKPETERIAGQISFPGESRKIGGEHVNRNIIGALMEFTDDDNLVRNNLFLTNSSRTGRQVVIKSNPFDMVILVYNGLLSRPINPVDQNEVKVNGWMTLTEIKQKDPMKDPRIVRGFVHQIARIEESERLIHKVVADYYKSVRIPVSSILPPDFQSMRQFYEARERLRDANINT